ncbi:GntP family permease [Halalkalibacter krulwichiae]|uniref:Fructuronate transporter n=1 Tax=Halalkalibacter krulwichiae TaxID=199441 RepID=A0A1X9ML89_9BACI|nr:SLC13 family permease [Halalkalibacter krulwichiae]ARK32571.1 fructuronate transporter [Halalkalibacter krulwichiae]
MDLQLLSLIGIVVGLSLLIIFAMKGYSLLIVTPVLGVLVAVVSQIDITEALKTGYMQSFVNFVERYFLLFLFGAIFGKVMEDSGAATSIARGILKVTGESSRIAVIFAMVLITGVLTYGGVSVFVVIFTMIPIARPVFKKLDIPWPIFAGAFFLGCGTFTMTMLPGSPQIQNLIPIPYLGTTPTAGALIGVVATLVVIPFGLWWLWREDKKYTSKNIGYEETKGNTRFDYEEKESYPPFLLSLLPPALLIILLNFTPFSIEISLGLSVIVAGLFLRKYLTNPLQTFNTGAMNVAAPILNTSAVVAFGGVVIITSGFNLVESAVMSIPGHPLIAFSIATNIMSGITGSTSGGLGIAMEALSGHYKTMIDPEVLHRIATISSGGLDSLPHSGAVVTGLTVMGLTHKMGYKPVFFVNIVAPLLALVFAMAVAIIFYG